MLKRFGEQMPTQLGPNQMAQQQLQMKQQQDKARVEMGRGMLEYAKAQMETEGKLDVAKLNAYKSFEIARFNAGEALKQIKARGDVETAVENLRKNNEFLIAEAKVGMDMRNPMKQMEYVGEITKNYGTLQGTLAAQRRDILAEIDKEIKTGSKDQGRISELRNTLDQVTKADFANSEAYSAQREWVKKTFGIDVPAMPPPPQVGEGEAPKGLDQPTRTPLSVAPPGGYSAAGTPSDIPDSDIDPFTGKQWDKSVAPGERYFLNLFSRLPTIPLGQ
jgi:hypothetical protein